ncbi:MAG: hypothetical protein IJP27_08880 [Clostridia bacterium]|nr:hypothetical protein [Clostridia bacterium]
MDWKLGTLQHSAYKKTEEPYTVKEVEALCEMIPAEVPGAFELDMIRAGKLPEDIFKGTNVLQLQKLEATHLFYCTAFEVEEKGMDAFLVFEGIDTFAEIYMDGYLLDWTENMHLKYEYRVKPGKHELMVHIIPACIKARELDLPVNCYGQPYNHDSMLMRKAPYMFGWDIMPRIVSAGLWREVRIDYLPYDRFEQFDYRVMKIKGNKASLRFSARIHTEQDLLHDLVIKIEGRCKDHSFVIDKTLYSINERIPVSLEDPYLWWPRNYGDPDLYEVTAYLMKGEEILDRRSLKMGIRTAELDRTDKAGPEGKFRFVINGKPVYVMGSNWVPTDPFPCRQHLYTERGLRLAEGMNCNMLRCWGGNIYPEDAFYDYCDAHGIMIWQDFAMGCGFYPWNEEFQQQLREEATYIVRKLGNHPCIVLWAGDNECDYNTNDPEANILTRKILKEVVLQEAHTTPYLPSSPYFAGNRATFGKPAEDHLWGPRDYFKGQFYGTAISHFVSETGYHGCNSPASIKRFISEEHLENFRVFDEEWTVHSTSIETKPNTVETHASGVEIRKGSPYAYRIPLMAGQVDRLFVDPASDRWGFAKQSQISQAEANKYFIERFRIRKGYTGGMLWWNVIDGWPQFSDAVVDWYGCKKLAYHYTARSQSPFCLMMDEPDENGNLTLCAANDTQRDLQIRCTVTNALTGEVVLSGEYHAPADRSVRLAQLPEEAVYYLIEWEGDLCGKNHFVGKIGEKVQTADYDAFMKKVGFDAEFEGF